MMWMLDYNSDDDAEDDDSEDYDADDNDEHNWKQLMMTMSPSQDQNSYLDIAV